MKLLTTHDIGSLAKPPWRVKAMRNIPLNNNDIDEAVKWGEKLHIDALPNLKELLQKRNGFSPQEKNKILLYSSLYGTKFLEAAGLDIVWDGEQHRVEMYEYPIRRTNGFTFHGHVRSFDNKYYRRASCELTPECKTPYHLEEYRTIQSFASCPVKIPVTGAYTLADWSYDSYYRKDTYPGGNAILAKQKSARKQFLSDLASRVIYPNLKALVDEGAQYLQIDEPAAATKRAETDLFIDAMKKSISDLAGRAFFSVHICYSAYHRLFPKILELEGYLNEIHLEYANRDSRELGISDRERPGYSLLKLLKDTPFNIGLGVLDIHTDWIEPPELVRDRILHACRVLGDPSRILVAPDCGLRTRTWKVAFEKLRNLTAGVQMARTAINPC
ncbi:putative methylcobalamin:homocysteine methyltransferase [Waddlia chondrophila 2032/99]|uniref:5-methyltetrahydropteroyltriglutamate--homocysteine methyltransferase n=2 Tax=Waddlia chondrophila TaxID=71667 RepID=D6YSN4_WADCW|nr:hypothetical protein [Waddlia chondrophila]ADI39079.1 5-methyltetrahydropteroyltriglutamate-- homocysteine methyltransferase [Waddlia chondrophila WSU 86-1044]CCB92191.1 putative methylcobalamin:homocysteine methyltransferase [Waddlia chondrophila 2032/99]